MRDPVARIISHYVHLRDGGRENRSLNEALSDFEGNQYIDCSRYHMQLQQYLSHFSQSWLGRKIRLYVPRSIVYWAAAYGPKERAVVPPSLDSGLREALCDYLREDVERLRSQVGRDFAEWSI